MRWAVTLVTVGLVHAKQEAANFTNPMMSSEDLELAQARWEAAMNATPDLSAVSLTCSADFRRQFPSCSQYEPEWCWATAVAEVWGFYDPAAYAKESGGNCYGFECQIAGHILHPDSPQTCCEAASRSECGKRAGYPKDTIEGILWTTKKTYQYYGGPLSEQELDDTLSHGHPVLLVVTWSNGGGSHMLTLGGCAGGGLYYLHDPSAAEGGQANFYQTLSYNQILKYVPPKAPSGVYGAWHQTFSYHSGEAADAVIV